MKLENTQIIVWSAIDGSEECLATWVSKGRSSFEAYVFLRMVLKYCKNEPEFVVDRGTWYLWGFQELGLKYRNVRRQKCG